MFKNAIAYIATPGFCINPELLSRRPARECQPLESATDGFVPPCSHASDGLLHSFAGYQMICWQTDDKVLPGSVVEEEVCAKVADIECQQGRRVGRKERKEIKERVIDELLPRAFVQKRRTLAVLGRGYFIIDTSSPARAEELLDRLRHTLGTSGVSDIRTEKQAAFSMAQWLLSSDPPEDLTIDDDCVLEGVAHEEKPTVRYARTDANATDVRERIANGYLPKSLALTYADKVSFVLTSEMHLKRLSLIDIAAISEQREQAQDVAEAFDVDMTICIGETIRVIDYLIAALGGMQKAAQPDLLAESGTMAKLNDRLAELAPDVAYDEAKRVVIESGRASISFVQRNLRIGYNHAARLIEQMEKDGIVSAMDGRGNREVLVKETAHA